jgi:hypothetical protein
MRSIFGRKAFRTLARLALAGFLFVQAAIAVAGCELGANSAAQAIVNASAEDGHPCHEESSDSAATLCVAHCVTQTQSLEKPFWKAPSAAFAPVLVFVVFSPPAALPAPVADLPSAAAGPPRRILFRTLLI